MQKELKKEDKIDDKKNNNKVEDKKEDNKKEVKEEEKKTTKKVKSKKNKKSKDVKDVDTDDKPQKKKEKNTAKNYINSLLAKAEKELFRSTTEPSTKPEQKIRTRKKHTKILDNNKICHYFLKKGTDININEYDYFPIQKVKKQGNILSKLNINIKIGGIFKNKKKTVKFTDYYLFIDEYFIYFCKDIIVFTSDQDKRRIGSAVSLFNVTNIICQRENDMFKIQLELKLRKASKSKEFYVSLDDYKDLMAQFNEIKKEYDLNYKTEMI